MPALLTLGAAIAAAAGWLAGGWLAGLAGLAELTVPASACGVFAALALLEFGYRTVIARPQ